MARPRKSGAFPPIPVRVNHVSPQMTNEYSNPQSYALVTNVAHSRTFEHSLSRARDNSPCNIVGVLRSAFKK